MEEKTKSKKGKGTRLRKKIREDQGKMREKRSGGGEEKSDKEEGRSSFFCSVYFGWRLNCNEMLGRRAEEGGLTPRLSCWVQRSALISIKRHLLWGPQCSAP